MTTTDLGPLDWRIGIVDKTGRPTPEFQRRWNSQRNNNALIGVIPTGSGAPTGTPSDGQAYIDISSTPWTLYVGNNNNWSIVGVVNFTDLLDVPHSYSGLSNALVQVKPSEDGLQFAYLSSVMDNVFGYTEGDILVRDSSGWVALSAGTSTDVLTSNGPGAVPSWQPSSGGGGGGSGAIVDGIPVALPALGALTWLNQGGATATAYTNGPITMNVPAQSGDQIRGLQQNVPSAPWTMTAKLGLMLWNSNFYTAGIYVIDGSGKLTTFNIGYAGPSMQVSHWNGVTSYNSGAFGKASQMVDSMWFRIYNDGTNYIYKLSRNGADWITVYQEGVSTFLGSPSAAGVYVDINDTSGFNLNETVSIWSFELASGTGTDSHW